MQMALGQFPSQCGMEFSSVYRRRFDLWWRELGAGSYVSIWLFENIMQMALGQFPSQCGMLGRCAPQFVVESDGSVYPCDFYALDEYREGYIRTARVFARAPSRLFAVRGQPLRGHEPSQLQALEHRVLRRGVLRPARVPRVRLSRPSARGAHVRPALASVVGHASRLPPIRLYSRELGGSHGQSTQRAPHHVRSDEG